MRKLDEEPGGYILKKEETAMDLAYGSQSKRDNELLKPKQDLR